MTDYCYTTSYQAGTSGGGGGGGYAAQTLNKDLEEYKKYIIEQKELINRIHQQQKKLKSIHHNQTRPAPGRSSSHASRSCYFPTSSGCSSTNSSVPAPVSRCSYSNSLRLTGSPPVIKSRTVKCANVSANISTSLNNLENWCPMAETSYTCFDNKSQSNLSQYLNLLF